MKDHETVGKIKNCPMCDCYAVARETDSGDTDPFYYVECAYSTCGIRTLDYYAKAKAIESWNRRAASASRKEIVREAFTKVALELGRGELPEPNEFYYATSLATAMEKVLAEMEDNDAN